MIWSDGDGALDTNETRAQVASSPDAYVDGLRNAGFIPGERSVASAGQGALPTVSLGTVPMVAETEAGSSVSEPASDVPPADPPPVVDAPTPVTPVEAAICGYPWECGVALRVAACESGPDYTAGYNASGHAGTFQISPIHAWRFSARGLDFWTDAVVLEVNLEVAFEIYQERWWWAWSCF